MTKTGLSSKQAALNLKLYGFNELPGGKKSVFFSFLFKLFQEPMFLFLMIGAGLYFVLGSKIEGIMLLGFILVIMTLTSYQQNKSDKAILSLHNLSSPRALVMRDGVCIRIAGREVVPGDIIVLNEGDSICADAQVLACSNLLVNESILTGEANSVSKIAIADLDNESSLTGEANSASKMAIPDETIETIEIIEISRPGGDNLPFVYSGTQIVQGNGYAKVIATGSKTQMGLIGKSLVDSLIERTDLQKETDVLVRNFATFGLILCIVVAISYGATRAHWLNGFLVGITLAMSALPEELPVILAIFLALGAIRLSVKNVLTRRIPAVEALGATTVLCVDKTGTITQNLMKVSQLFVNGEYFDVVDASTNAATCSVIAGETVLPEQFHQILEYSVLASQRDPFDPMEIAIKNFGVDCLRGTEHLHEFWQLIYQYPLSKELLAISQVWQSAKNQDYVVAAKGAPEAIFDLCHLTPEQIKDLLLQIENMAKKGLRVIGVAKAVFHDEVLPKVQHDFNFEFLGLIGLEDPVRPNIIESVKSCFLAGIRIIMLTGDYFGTAQYVAQKIGLQNTDSAITGPELAKMNDLELAQKIKHINIFARILPEQKLRIVNALKTNDEVVAMTGDGVNDAPALQSADIGVAMGKHGTDVARQAAALVLLDDNFSSLVAAIRIGRRVYANIKRAMVYTLAAHIPIIGMTLIPVLCKWPLMFHPIHIVFLEMIINPACSIVFEAEDEEADIMNRPPRSNKEKLFDRKTVRSGVLQGLGALLVSLSVFMLFRYLGYPDNTVRAITFAVFVVTNITLIFLNTTIVLHNRALWLVSGSAVVFLAVVLCVPYLRVLFYF